MNKLDNLNAMLAAQPYKKLGLFPTPLQKLERLSKELGINLYIKRDDLSGLSQFGGNKMRKLEFLIGDALEKGCDTVFTYGATQSNHAMQTATAARVCGLEPVLFLRAIVEPDAENVRANLLLDNILGAEQHILAKDADVPAIAAARRAELEAEGRICYDIPGGGANEVGSLGFIKAYIEMRDQLEEDGVMADFVFAGTGSGGTLGGLMAAASYLGDPTKIMAVRVSDSVADYVGLLRRLSNEVLAHGGIEHTVDMGVVNILEDYWQPGYEIPSEGANAAIKRLARTQGIFTDPVYSGKAFYGLIDCVEKGIVPQGSNVVFWHTGGATALFAEPEIIGSLKDI